MSNNIYDIIKKLESLEAPKKTLNESKSMNTVKELHNESKKESSINKGSIAEAVAQVEKQLSEKFHNYKKAVEESGLMYHAGVKKHGQKYMELAKKAGQKGASQEELGRLKDKHSKAYKNKKMDEADYNEDMLSPKQQKFAKLAPPPNKITYADKIAGAKKKDEGNEFSGELVKARAQGKDSFEVDGKSYPVKEGFPSKEEAEKRMKEREGKTTHGKKTSTKTGMKHERDYDKHDSDKDTGDEKRGRGRPKKDKFAE